MQERREGKKAKHYQLPPFRLPSKRKRKKNLGKEPVFKQHDLCRVSISRNVLLAEEPQKNLRQETTVPTVPDSSSTVAMVTSKASFTPSPLQFSLRDVLSVPPS